MFTRLNPDLILEGVNVALEKEVLPHLASDKAQVTVVMIQTMIQSVRNAMPIYFQALVEEHNDMQAILRDVGSIVGAASGDAADRIRGRANDLGGRPEIASLPASEAISAAHEELSRALVQTIADLDELAEQGHDSAEQALQRVRAHMGPRIARDFSTMVVGEGMVGRG